MEERLDIEFNEVRKEGCFLPPLWVETSESIDVMKEGCFRRA